jgi:WD40 repeat protein
LNSSLHPYGYSLVTGGLDNTVRVWDIRNFNKVSKSTGKSAAARALAECNVGKSLNSVFFSPSGSSAVATTMANRIEVFYNLHQVGQSDDTTMKSKKASSSVAPVHVKPSVSKYHDNNTGRWLTTFMGIFHPSYDVFCIGSMQRPRCIELFDPNGNALMLERAITGDSLTSVNSRCCFHPRTDRLIIAGGNSSGRVTIIR